jgi:hypothetical protein
MTSPATVPGVAEEAQDGSRVPLRYWKGDRRIHTKLDVIPAPVKEFGLKPHDVFGLPRGYILEILGEGAGGQNREGTVGGILRHPVHVNEDPKRTLSIHLGVDGQALATPQLDTIAPSLRRFSKQESLFFERKVDAWGVAEGLHRGIGPLHTQSGLCELHRTQRFHIGFVRRQVTKFVLDLIDLITAIKEKNGKARTGRPSRARAHVPKTLHLDMVLTI